MYIELGSTAYFFKLEECYILYIVVGLYKWVLLSLLEFLWFEYWPKKKMGEADAGLSGLSNPQLQYTVASN